MSETLNREALDSLKQIVAEAVEAKAKDNRDALENAIKDYDQRFDALAKKVEDAAADAKTAALGIGSAPPQDKSREDFRAFVRRGEVSDEMATNSNVDGGFLVPAPVATEIIRLSASGNPLRELAENVTVSGGEYAFLAETSDGAAGWVGETEAREETAGPKFAQQTIPVREVYAMPAVSRKLIDDAAFDVEAVVYDAAARAFSKVENEGFFTGTGPLKPQGLLTVPTVADASWEYGKVGTVKSGNASALTADGLVDLEGALADEYKSNAYWLMSGSAWNAARKLKQGASGADKYLLWTPEIIDGRLENLLLGYRVRKASAMPAVAANAIPVAFGDFRRAYAVVDRIGLRLLRDEYTRKGFVRMYFTRMVGGGVKNFEAVKFLKIEA